MSANPLRDLASAARDIRAIGMRRVPINIERACVIFVNQYAYHTTASIQSAIKIAKFAKWANCEVYYMIDPNIQEVGEVLQHFSTMVTKLTFFYFSGNPISQETIEGKACIKVSNGVIGPNYIYEVIDQKDENLNVVLCIDGVNRPGPWNPIEQELQNPHVAFFAPYPDPKQAHLQQLDLKNDTIFINEFWTAIKTQPSATLDTIARQISPELNLFGQNISAVTFPESDLTDKPFIL